MHLRLTPERLAEIRAIWEVAVELPAEDREAYVAGAAPDDPDLRRRVLKLLAAHESTGGVLSRPLLSGLRPADLLGATGLTGRTLGAYRITGELGRGGMGTVYEAVRADDQFTKKVAIKTLQTGIGSTDMLRRFRRERQIQATLAHPNIATLLDAGVTDDGIPYLVLEYIDGLPIDRFCDRNRLGLPARLDLFRQVIQAVQHAHRQLVVHRDLKPSNILVTREGTVKLLDFGISKLIGDASDHTATDGLRAFTTAYASPEQIRGEPISTATDVYSLGVVLYRILTGQSPFDLDHATPAAAWKTICEQPARPPSDAATPEAARSMGFATVDRLRRALRGELDAIVLMALRKEPVRRYPTADALGEDLQRHLRGLPVQARPDSAGYRIRKLVGRNRLAAMAAALAFLAMAGGTVVSLWQAREARISARLAEAARVAADKERRTAERTADFLKDIFASSDPSWAGRGINANATIAEAVEAAAERIERDLADEPEVAVALHRILSSTYVALHRADKGMHHAREQVRLLRAIGAPGLELARGLHDLGGQFYVAGQLDSSLMMMRQSYALFEQAGFPETEDLVITLNELGLVLWASGQPKEAIPYLIRGLDLNTRIGRNDAMTAVMSSNLGNAFEATGDLEGAERSYRQAEAILGRAAGSEMFERGVNLNNLAGVLTLKGEYQEAERLVAQAHGILERTMGQDHLWVAFGRLHQARIELATGRTEAALATARRGTASMIGHLGPDHPNVARGEVLAAAVLLELNRLGEAETLARRAVAKRTTAFPATDWRVAEAEGVLGMILAARGRHEEGETLLSRSHQTMRAAMGETHPRTRMIEEKLLAAATR